MAELQSVVESHLINGGFMLPAITLAEAPEAFAAVSAGSKRLRRSNVRLGDIGSADQYQHVAYDSHLRRSKWRPVESDWEVFENSNPNEFELRWYENTITLDDEDPISIGTWRVKKWVKSSGVDTTTTATTSAKRVGSNWATKIDEPIDGLEQGNEKFSKGEELEEGL